MAIAAMLDGFHMKPVDPSLTISTYEVATRGISDEAIIEAAANYLRGDARGENDVRFAPTVPAFVREARRIDEIIPLRRQMRNQQVAGRVAEEPFRRTPEQRARIKALHDEFTAHYLAMNPDEAERERERLRAAYGMTDEVLASIKDRPTNNNKREA